MGITSRREYRNDGRRLDSETSFPGRYFNPSRERLAAIANSASTFANVAGKYIRIVDGTGLEPELPAVLKVQAKVLVYVAAVRLHVCLAKEYSDEPSVMPMEMTIRKGPDSEPHTRTMDLSLYGPDHCPVWTVGLDLGYRGWPAEVLIGLSWIGVEFYDLMKRWGWLCRSDSTCRWDLTSGANETIEAKRLASLREAIAILAEVDCLAKPDDDDYRDEQHIISTELNNILKYVDENDSYITDWWIANVAQSAVTAGHFAPAIPPETTLTLPGEAPPTAMTQAEPSGRPSVSKKSAIISAYFCDPEATNASIAALTDANPGFVSRVLSEARSAQKRVNLSGIPRGFLNRDGGIEGIAPEPWQGEID